MQLRNLTLIGALTWLIIGVPSVMWELQRGGFATPRGLAWTACFLGFLAAYAVAARGGCPRNVEVALLVVEALFALACSGLQPSGFQPVLLVIIAGQLGALSLRTAIVWIFVQSIGLAFVVSRTADENVIAVTLAYLAFQLFGVFATNIAHREAVARQDLAQANAELRLTTALLDMSSRSSERLRISRDLHDLLGHHLTALSLNLEVASHLAEGEARESIEKSKAITKLLLSDVRDVVSTMREEEPVDLAGALASLRDAIATPAVHLDIASDVAVVVVDTAVAQAALRAVQEIVTNTVRHAGARNLWLRLTTNDQALDIDARDDGEGTDELRFGNGLRGMRERVEHVRGNVEVTSARGAGFAVRVHLPLTGELA